MIDRSQPLAKSDVSSFKGVVFAKRLVGNPAGVGKTLQRLSPDPVEGGRGACLRNKDDVAVSIGEMFAAELQKFIIG